MPVEHDAEAEVTFETAFKQWQEEIAAKMSRAPWLACNALCQKVLSTLLTLNFIVADSDRLTIIIL